MRDEDATDASSVTEKCSPERARQEERDQDTYKYRQRANLLSAQTDECRKNLMRHPATAHIHHRIIKTSECLKSIF